MTTQETAAANQGGPPPANSEVKELTDKLDPPPLDESKKGPVDNLPARQYLEQTVVPIVLQVIWTL